MSEYLALVGLALGLPFGWLLCTSLQDLKKRGKTLVVGLDPTRRDILMKWLKVGLDGDFEWEAGDSKGKITLGEQVPWTLNGMGRAFIINRKTLQPYGAEDPKNLTIAPDDGWSLAIMASGIHHRNVARTGGEDWLASLSKYTPILVFGLIIIVLGTGAMLSGQLSALGGAIP